MICCDNLIHPFQNDPGTSQRQRVADELLAGASKIDARTMAELLHYFTQLSGHITHYDSALTPGDWKPFFARSVPFALAGMVRYNVGDIKQRFRYYRQLFNKRPGKQGLQLLVHFMYYRLVAPVNQRHLVVKGSGLPIEVSMEKLIRDTLADQVKKFICLSNAAVQRFNIARIDLNSVRTNSAWNFTSADLVQTQCFQPQEYTQPKQLRELYDALADLFSGLISAVELSGNAAAMSLEKSLFPLQEELQKQHPPHLAIIFAFLKLFQYLQQDLNGFTRKHLDFFYQDVIKLVPRDAVPDRAFILFQIQKQLDKYRLAKDTEVQGDKDNNKAPVNFALQDELVVNKAEVIDVRTLFLSPGRVHVNGSPDYSRYIEGVYRATDARKADGTIKPFPEEGPANWSTFGDKASKYFDPEAKSIRPYANARLGFILGSPVLYLQEGIRTITMRLACTLGDPCSAEVSQNIPSRCCEDQAAPVSAPAPARENDIPIDHLLTAKLAAFNAKLQEQYYYISKDIIAQAVKQGVARNITDRLLGFLEYTDPQTGEAPELCYCPRITHVYDRVVNGNELLAESDPKKLTPEELALLGPLLAPIKAFDVKLSGEKAWITPDATAVEIVSVSGNNFILQFTLTVGVEADPVTFFNKDVLKEDYETTEPVAKIELNDKVKFEQSFFEEIFSSYQSPCCLEFSKPSSDNVSLYQLFRNVVLRREDTTIAVKVCGVKNFIVQNDQNVMDIKGTIYPFGAQPDIVDFDLHNPISNVTRVPGYPEDMPDPIPNLSGSNFYIGSREIFLKSWDSVCVRLNWKDKPVSFNEYYKAYIKRVFPDNGGLEISGLDEDDFQINLSLLENGRWNKEISSPKVIQNSITTDFNRKLFAQENCGADCVAQAADFTHAFHIERSDFPGSTQFADLTKPLTAFDKAGSRQGFIRFNLQNQDFFHRDYAFVLARQMMALGKYPDQGVEGAVYYTSGNSVIVFRDTGAIIVSLVNDINDLDIQTSRAKDGVDQSKDKLELARASDATNTITDDEYVGGAPSIDTLIQYAQNNADLAADTADEVVTKFNQLQTLLSIFTPDGKLKSDFSVPIPAEPWTPIIENMSIDYTATATLNDITLVHLHAFDNTYQQVAAQGGPTLLPTYCDEGSLYIGLKGIIPGGSLNLLFKLAEATANAESGKQAVAWHYLDNNTWKPLREGFEIIKDGTNGFTATGIVTLAIPQGISLENTVMPAGLYWLKASVAANSKAVSETIAIHPNAVEAVFTNRPDNDTLRLHDALPAGSLAKLKVADANVKSVSQPYPSFGGREPEAEHYFYVRASEQLRHKGRAIQKWDYERITLDAFPAIFKAKCINHSYALNAGQFKNDFPMAPGYVLVAVIPDLTQLDAGRSFEPKAPVSTLDAIARHIKARTSPFVRVQVMNPRYEKLRFCLKVQLYRNKDENYYKEKLQQDLREFLAPWAVGEYSKLSFGQCVNRSDILRFLEGLDYLDFVHSLRMQHEEDPLALLETSDVQQVCPRTPRSILLAGDIDICIAAEACETWDEKQRCAHLPERLFL